MTLFATAISIAVAGRAIAQPCSGDCNCDGRVTASDLTKTIAILLLCDGAAHGCTAVPDGCIAGDRDGDGSITIDEVMFLIHNVLATEDGCPGPSPTSTPTRSASSSPTFTLSPTTAPTSSRTPTASAVATPTHSATLVPSRTPTTVAIPTSTLTPSATASEPPPLTASPTATVSRTPTTTDIASPNPSVTATATASVTSTATAIDTATSTATIGSTATATATASATVPSSVCGNGFLEAGETCTTCAPDCMVRACTATTPIRTFTVNFTAPADQTVTGITVLVGYRSGNISLPGSGSASTVGARVKNKPANAIVAANDLDYALRVVISRSSALPAGRLLTIDFDSCQGGTVPTAAEFGCSVQGCANTFGSVPGCSCSVAQ
ncbi:MAG: hypothetical protein HY270_07790 [Deltaproteobacteria bacterium]|nr:hypothetical protein [Deltaproteobacteria bacterium]